MIINKMIIQQIEDTHRILLPKKFKKYLLVNYGQEPFPYEYSEQDLYTNIEKDISAYKAGELEVTLKKPSLLWKEEREYLQGLYAEKCHEVHRLEEYIVKLEDILSKNGLNKSNIAMFERESY
ncbi:MAG: hypothetical protein Q8942_15970 [Bacillota bacterium]|nr:hypothetical protein [Bacillota bacterium]